MVNFADVLHWHINLLSLPYLSSGVVYMSNGHETIYCHWKP